MARKKTTWTAASLLANTTDDAGCMVWSGRMHTQNSAPLVDHDGERWMVRRLLLTFLDKPPAPGAFVCCTCETPGCINPDHLRVLSASKHLAKAATSPTRNETLRRHRIAATKQARHARLTPEQVQWVRTSPLSGAEVARQLGVHRSLTNRIRRGAAWAQPGNPWAGLGAR